LNYETYATYAKITCVKRIPRRPVYTSYVAIIPFNLKYDDFNNKREVKITDDTSRTIVCVGRNRELYLYWTSKLYCLKCGSNKTVDLLGK